MIDILAGTACGFLMGSTSVVVGSLMLLNAPALFAKLEPRLPKGVTPTPVLAMLALAIPILWGIAGGFLGLIYRFVRSAFPYAGLGSPNLAFTAAMLLIAIAATLPMLVVSRRHWGGFLALTIAFAALFGWLLPLLAS